MGGEAGMPAQPPRPEARPRRAGTRERQQAERRRRGRGARRGSLKMLVINVRPCDSPDSGQHRRCRRRARRREGGSGAPPGLGALMEDAVLLAFATWEAAGVGSCREAAGAAWQDGGAARSHHTPARARAGRPTLWPWRGSCTRACLPSPCRWRQPSETRQQRPRCPCRRGGARALGSLPGRGEVHVGSLDSLARWARSLARWARSRRLERGFCLLKGIAEGTYKTKHADLTKFVQNAGLGSLAGLARSLGSLGSLGSLAGLAQT